MEDYKIDTNTEDLTIKDGDFDITNDNGQTNDKQNLFDIISSASGTWRISPRMGVDIKSYLNGSATGDDIVSKIRQELYNDDFKVYSIDLELDEVDTIKIDVNAKHKI